MKIDSRIRKHVDIIVPFYNEEPMVNLFLEQLLSLLPTLKYDFQLILINDGSTDQTGILLSNWRDQKTKKFKNVQISVINFSRNFGHQSALIAGLLKSNGDCVITMDGDLQHPPMIILQMLEEWESGFEVVQTVRLDTEGVNRFKKSTSNFFYKFVKIFTEMEIRNGSSDFRLLSKNANQQLTKLFTKWSSRDFLLRIVIPNFGFRTSYIEFIAPARFAGKSHFSLMKMSKLFLAAGISYTKFPVYLVIILNSIFSLIITFATFFISAFSDIPTFSFEIFQFSLWIAAHCLLGIIDITAIYAYKTYREVSYQPVFIERE